MSTGIWSAASGAVSQSYALDVTANNLANVATPGYRADRAVFRQELARAVQRGEGRALRYSLVRSATTDFSAGQVVHTGRALDVALRSDKSFFVVRTPQGERYTRAGNVRISADGTLVTPEGHAYLDPMKKPILVPPDSKTAAFDEQGRLSLDGAEGSARLLVVTFPTPDALEREGNVLFRAPPAAGKPTEAPADLELEALETSNASSLSGITNMVTASRQFEMLTRVIEAFSAIDKKAATDVMAKR
jgi:flagellar basal body rod protein FlgG